MRFNGRVYGKEWALKYVLVSLSFSATFTLTPAIYFWSTELSIHLLRVMYKNSQTIIFGLKHVLKTFYVPRGRFHTSTEMPRIQVSFRLSEHPAQSVFFSPLVSSLILLLCLLL